MTEQAIKNEMRLFALESVFCQHLATVYHALPPELFEAVRKQTMDGVRRLTFPDADAAHSDLFSAELEAALDRLYKMIGSHLEKAQNRAKG